MALPPDFERFWRDATAEALALPLDASSLAPSAQNTATHRVDSIAFRGADGSRRYAWMATPQDASARRGFVWVPPYSRWSMKPDVYGTRPGYASLSPNLLGESAFHSEVYKPERGYFAEGVGSPHTWIFRRLYQDSVLALRLLHELADLDGSRSGAMGMSQGAGISVWLGAWSGLVSAVVADMPFLGLINQVLAEERAFRYPLKELVDWRDANPSGPSQLAETLSYYDTATQAAFCRVPTLVTLGLKDPAVKPLQAEAVYDALPGQKELVRLDWGHDWHPSMVERNQAWLEQHLAP